MATSKGKAEKEGQKWRKHAESMWDHFHEIYGTRWETSLCRALLGPSKMCALMNPCVVSNAEEAVVLLNQLVPIHWAPESMKAYISTDKTRIPAPIRDETHGLPNYYCMDPASILPVLALDLQRSPRNPIVLDLCGAPGGKTLAIHRLLSELGGGLVSNEPSKFRRERLETVISEHIVDTTSVTVTSLDGVEFGNPSHDFSDLEGSLLLDGTQALAFTHVLCDAPCSGERHILKHSSGGEWTGKSLRNTRRQIALLKAAWGACGDGGTIVYSTCSLSPAENDDIVTKLFSQRACKVQKLSFPIGEPTELGWMILPDHQSSIGMGPIYTAAIQKVVEPT